MFVSVALLPLHTLLQLQAFTERIIEKIQEAAIDGTSIGSAVEDGQAEGNRRAAHYGNQGMLSQAYKESIPSHLAMAAQLKALSVRHLPFPVLGVHSARAMLTQIAAALKQQAPDLTVNIFSSTSPGQLVHFNPPQDWTKIERHVDTKLRDLHCILIGRNLTQFHECLYPEARVPRPWLDQATKLPLQLFQPLDPLKASKNLPVPLQHMPIAAEAFVPRQRLVVAMVTSNKVF